MHDLIVSALICLNLIAFVLFGADKRKAVRNAWRTPESVLLLSAILGGGPGAYAGMRFFHHKTRKPIFALGVPLIALLEYGAAAAYLLQS